TTNILPLTPICLCSVPGYNASYLVQSPVTSTNSQCTSISMGSQEGYGVAVLLKNVNLASSWLSQLEKELIVLNPPNYLKLFLTMETNTSKCLTPVTNPNEPLPGNRANMVDCLRSIFLACLSSGPNEKAQICFLLAW
ncbi:hypothetical protein BY996DRAFT_8413803, partial [Phakopsora pachyrhizi]